MRGDPVRRDFSIQQSCLCNTGSPAFADDVGLNTPSRSRGTCARGLRESLAHEIEGAGKCRVRAAPAARVHWKKAHGSHTGSAETPGIPRAMVLTAYTALSSATNSSCHRRRRMSGLAEPGWARNTSADLTPATGARTTRFRRPHQRRSSARRPDRSQPKPPCNLIARRRCRVHRIPPNVRDDRETPLVGMRRRGL